MYPVITIGGVMYLKDRSPYLDSSFPYSKSQNIIKVNLLGTYSTVNTPLRRVCLYYLALSAYPVVRATSVYDNCRLLHSNYS